MNGLLELGIDCAPGAPRPNVRAAIVFDKLNMPAIEPYNKIFGAWSWSIPCTDTEYATLKPWLKETMDKMYDSGKIRGAQWSWEALDGKD